MKGRDGDDHKITAVYSDDCLGIDQGLMEVTTGSPEATVLTVWGLTKD